MARDGRPKAVPDEDLLDAVLDAVQDGDTDPANGGVHPEVLAERLPLSESTIKDRCRRLRADGQLVKVRGLNPRLRSPRWSYWPATDDGATSTRDS